MSLNLSAMTTSLLRSALLAKRTKSLNALIGGATCFMLAISSQANAQRLEDVLNSEAMYELNIQAGKTKKTPKKAAHLISNYDSIWMKKQHPSVLLNWLGIHVPDFVADIGRANLQRELARAEATFTDRSGVKVQLSVLVPSPTYITMAEYKTLAEFNRFRPPALDVVAEQSLEIQGLQAKYYRSREGSCSLLFNTTKYSIVNLSTKKCADSNVMMRIAKSLNFERLKEKLES